MSVPTVHTIIIPVPSITLVPDKMNGVDFFYFGFFSKGLHLKIKSDSPVTELSSNYKPLPDTTKPSTGNISPIVT